MSREEITRNWQQVGEALNSLFSGTIPDGTYQVSFIIERTGGKITHLMNPCTVRVPKAETPKVNVLILGAKK